MNQVNTAILLLDPSPSGYSLLLEHEIATVPLFKRWVLTLDRAGMEYIFVISRKLDCVQIKKIAAEITNDPRFRKKLIWYDQESFLKENGMKALRSAVGDSLCLLASGNILASFRLIRAFVEKGSALKALGEERNIGLAPHQQQSAGGVQMIASDNLDIVERFAQNRNVEMPLKIISIDEKINYWAAVVDHASIQRAEKFLIQNQKYHHNQVMDQVSNTILSIPITRVLLSSSITPNQITLFGVFIGFISCCLFAMGNFMGGLLGGVAAVATAVTDCCDGEIARLKFLDSNSGEYLDRICDNIINMFVFLGIAIGMGREFGLLSALGPSLLIALGGGTIFYLIYYNGEKKGTLFEGTSLFKAIQLLATRDFLYLVLAFGIIGKTHWFLWIASVGSALFAVVLCSASRQKRLAPAGRFINPSSRT